MQNLKNVKKSHEEIQMNQNQEEEGSDSNIKPAQMTLTIEKAMQKVGEKHKYQIQATILSFITWFITTYGYMVLPYFFSPPDFECFYNDKWVKCTEDTGACDPNVQVNMLTDKSSTIAADFNLYCDGRHTRVFLQSMPLFAGVMGTFTFGYISDKYGRKKAIKLCWIIGCFFSIFFNISGDVISLVIGSFGVGFSALILQNMFVIHMNELSSGKFRVMALLGMYVFWSISEMQYIWMMNVLPNWRSNMFAFYTLPLSVLIVFALKWIHDSPRYLYSKDRTACIEHLNMIARVNGRECVSEQELQVYPGRIGQDYGYLDLFQYKSQRFNTIIISVIFLFVNFLYQGTQVVLSTIGNSFGLNSFYVGVGELLGFAFSDFISHRIPRKQGIFYSLALTCLICMSFSFYPVPSECESDSVTCWQKYFQGFMVSLARAVTSLTFGLELLLCGEMYPSTLKSLGYGFNLAVGFFGTFLAPSAVDLARELDITPIAFIGFISFLGNFATLYVTETLNIASPLDIPEVLILQQINRNTHPQAEEEVDVNYQENDLNELPEQVQERKQLNN